MVRVVAAAESTHALGLLHHLARYESNVELIVRARPLPALVALVRDGCDEQKSTAIVVLGA